jgi:hypothetical protein
VLITLTFQAMESGPPQCRDKFAVGIRSSTSALSSSAGALVGLLRLNAPSTRNMSSALVPVTYLRSEEDNTRPKDEGKHTGQTTASIGGWRAYCELN